MVERTDEHCHHPDPVKYFWCRRAECFLDVVVCISRQSKGNRDCATCRKQKTEIYDLRKIINRYKPRPEIPITPVIVNDEDDNEKEEWEESAPVHTPVKLIRRSEKTDSDLPPKEEEPTVTLIPKTTLIRRR
jgi:hypothetical protein